MTEIQIIPLAQLKASDLNVRKTGGKKVDELAASIRATGLQQNLGVVPNGKGYGVVFGGRRLRALQQLKKAGELPESLADGIPCRVLTAEEAAEASLAENTIRQAMHPLDQFRAFKALVEDGQSHAEVGSAFGVTELYVRQAMRLERVSEKLVNAYASGDMTLEQLQAFAVVDDHGRQEALWKRVKGSQWESEPPRIRRELMREEVGRGDDRVQLVGLDAYVAAGGELRRDLFSDEVTVLDVPLLDRLANAALEEAAELLRADGWSWVEVGGEYVRWETPRIDGEERDLTDAEAAEMDALEDRFDAGEMTIADHVRWAELEAEVFTLEQKAASGVRLRLDRGLQIHFGLLRDGEKPPAVPKQDAAPAGDDRQTVQVGTHERTVKKPGDPSFAAVQRLQAEATAIVQLQVARAPHTAMALLVAELAKALYAGPELWDEKLRHWVYIGGQGTGRVGGPHRAVVEEGPFGQQLEALEKEWRAQLPKKPSDLNAWALKQDMGTLQQLLAFLVGREIEAVDGAPSSDTGVVELAAAAGVDLADHWKPSLEWVETLPKAVIVAMATDAAGAKKAEPLAKLKKEQAASAAMGLFPARWIPKVLRAPEPESTRKKAPARGKMAAAGDNS